MGYTHYFSTKPKKSEEWDKAWPQLVKDMQKIYDAAAAEKLQICGPGKDWMHDGSEKPISDEEKGIIFNDIEEEGHETFTLGTDDDNGFCKTARKPYDWVVCLTLLRAYNLAPNCFRVSSDGEPSDYGWSHARELYKQIWPGEQFKDIWVKQKKST